MLNSNNPKTKKAKKNNQKCKKYKKGINSQKHKKNKIHSFYFVQIFKGQFYVQFYAKINSTSETVFPIFFSQKF